MWRLAAASALVLGLAVAGCGDDDDDDGGSAEPATLEIRATASGERKALEVPETVPAGLVTITLRNEDELPREAQLIRVTGGQSPEEVIEAVTSEGGPIPDFIQDGGGVAPVEPGQTGSVTQVLQPGDYVALDLFEPEGEEESQSNAELGSTASFTVEGDAGDAELPEAETTITAEDYSFEATGLKPGRNTVRFENAGEQLHHAILFPINEGVEFSEVEEAFSSEEGPEGPPPVDFESQVGTAVIDGGNAQNVELELKEGRYAALCFIQDREGGPPHVAKGMISELEVAR
jgi:hypothetical protein